MLGALGPHINSLRVHLGKTHPDDKKPHGWLRWADSVADRPWTAAIASLLILFVLALPIFQLELGQNDISALPKDSTSREAFEGMNDGFGPGAYGPLLIASEFASPEEARAGACRSCRKRSAGPKTSPPSPNRASTRPATSPSSP